MAYWDWFFLFMVFGLALAFFIFSIVGYKKPQVIQNVLFFVIIPTVVLGLILSFTVVGSPSSFILVTQTEATFTWLMILGIVLLIATGTIILIMRKRSKKKR